jgi:hypothetical protein
MVIVVPAEAAPVLPAMSVASAVIVFVPAAKADEVTTGVAPSYNVTVESDSSGGKLPASACERWV